MPLEFVDGLNQYPDGVTAPAGSGSIWIATDSALNALFTNLNPAHGNISLRTDNNNGPNERSCDRLFPSGPQGSVFIGCLCLISAGGAVAGNVNDEWAGLQLREQGGSSGDFFMVQARASDTKWVVRRNRNETVAISNQNVRYGVFNTIKMFYEVGAVNNDGNLYVQINDEIVYDGPVTNLNGNAAPVGADRMRLGSVLTTSGYYLWNDFFAYTNPSAGEITQLKNLQGWAVLDAIPNSNGPNQDWAPVGVTNGYEALDNRPYNLSEYIESGTVGDISDFGLTNLNSGPVQVVTVLAASHYYFAEKSDANPGSIQASLNGGAGADNTMFESPDYFFDNYQINPSTGLAWTPADLASILSSFERTA